MRQPVVLLAWELGQGLGHVTKARKLALELRKRGIRSVLAISNLAAASEMGLADEEVRQAPLWPMQSGAWKAKIDYAPATLGEFLAQAIFADADAIEVQIRAWRDLLSDIRPDLVVADYAPGVHLATRGRLPLLAFSVGYCLPPTHLAEFPRVVSSVRPLHEAEELVLARVNKALGATGDAPLERYPQVFDALDHAVISTPLLDPYRKHRRSTHLGPVISKRPALCTPGEGVFVYLWEGVWQHDWIIEGVARAGGPGIAYIPKVGPNTMARLQGAGFTVLSKPADIDTAFASAGVVVHHGGHGIASAAIAAGLPQVILSYDQEKALTAASLESIGVCRHVPVSIANPRAVEAAIREIRESADARRRAAELARENAPWFDVPAESLAADMIEMRLARGA
ncbi:MAG: nucleotide disphospho-sugar-binding domain-containing protein [Parvibaculaceae bacterium]